MGKHGTKYKVEVGENTNGSAVVRFSSKSFASLDKVIRTFKGRRKVVAKLLLNFLCDEGYCSEGDLFMVAFSRDMRRWRVLKEDEKIGISIKREKINDVIENNVA